MKVRCSICNKNLDDGHTHNLSEFKQVEFTVRKAAENSFENRVKDF